MSAIVQAKVERDRLHCSARQTEPLRSPLLHTIFIHSEIEDVERSLQTLKHARFRVKADIVLNSKQFTKKLGAKRYDLILAEYPAPRDWVVQAVNLLVLGSRHTPVIFLAQKIQREAVASLISKGAGLANYRSLVDTLDSEIKRSKRTGREFALLLFDLDDLKKINDRYGHPVGSQALCRLADTLSLSCRDIDTAARFGGDEFALVLPETSLESALLVSQRISNNFADDGRDPKLSVSVGVASYPKDGEAIEPLLAAADVALYAMKARAHRHESGRQVLAQTARAV